MARKKYNLSTKYTVMWVLVMFDLPVKTKIEARRATHFRTNLLELGFIMKQFSVYMRHCESLEKAEKIAEQVKPFVVDNGHVSVIFITDRQYSMTKNYYGKVKKRNEEQERIEQGQLLIF